MQPPGEGKLQESTGLMSVPSRLYAPCFAPYLTRLGARSRPAAGASRRAALPSASLRGREQRARHALAADAGPRLAPAAGRQDVRPGLWLSQTARPARRAQWPALAAPAGR